MLYDLSSLDYSLISGIFRFKRLALFEIGKFLYAILYRLLNCSCHVPTFLLKPIVFINSDWMVPASAFLIFSNWALIFGGSKSPGN
jgi:hypothetical protein